MKHAPLALACAAAVAAAAGPALIPCHSDAQCDVTGAVRWRCHEAPAGFPPSAESNCHLPGPQTAGNGTCVCGASGCGAYAATPTPRAGDVRYLMIGDSISLGYEGVVRKALAQNGTAPWWQIHTPGNAASANLGAHCIDTWLAVPNVTAFDVISFNFGLHDLAHDTELLTGDLYTVLLTQLTARLVAYREAHGTKLLWINTTPVPTVATYDPTGPCNDVGKCLNPPRYDADVQQLNRIASAIMAANDIPQLDLYTYVLTRCGGAGYAHCTGFQNPMDVHFTPAGWEALAGQVVPALLAL